MAIWFTADQHFRHENIIKYCYRPYDSVKVMDSALVQNFNRVVGMEDITYHLGDIAMDGPENKWKVKRIIDKLNGKHVLIYGNHDRMNPFHYVDMGFLHVHTYLHLPEYDLHLVHDPAMAQDRDKMWLCGHVHNVFKVSENGNIVNVGVDVWGYTPVSLEEVLAAFRKY